MWEAVISPDIASAARLEESARRSRESQKRDEEEQDEKRRREQEEQDERDAEFISQAMPAELIKFVFGSSREGAVVMAALCADVTPPPPHGGYCSQEEEALRVGQRQAYAETRRRQQEAFGPCAEILKYRLRFKENWRPNVETAVRKLWRAYERATLGHETLSYPDIEEDNRRREAANAEYERRKLLTYQ